MLYNSSSVCGQIPLMPIEIIDKIYLTTHGYSSVDAVEKITISEDRFVLLGANQGDMPCSWPPSRGLYREIDFRRVNWTKSSQCVQ